MNAKLRPIGLWVALFTTLGLAVYLKMHEDDSDSAVVAVNSVDPGPKNSQPNMLLQHDAGGVKLSLLQQKLSQQDVGRDIFMVHRKVPEPAAKKAEIKPVVVSLPAPVLPVAPPVAPKPTAPALPFTYIGKLGDEGHYTVFLSVKTRSFVVKVGDVITQTYRVDEIKPPMMTLTYLPLSIKQTLPIGEAN